jgi:hypothetical protein
MLHLCRNTMHEVMMQLAGVCDAQRSMGVKREQELEAAVQRLSAALRQSHQQRRLLVQQLGMLRSRFGVGDPRAEVSADKRENGE